MFAHYPAQCIFHLMVYVLEASPPKYIHHLLIPVPTPEQCSSKWLCHVYIRVPSRYVLRLYPLLCYEK